MKKLFFLLVTCISIPALSQENKEQQPKPVEIKWSGFIMNQMYYDTRKNYEALDGLVLLFPLKKDTDALGKDINAVQNLNLLSFATRLRTNITGPDALGAKTSGLIEMDFTSRANSATVRFRQGWVKLAWEKSELLVGRTWHPLVSTDVTPSVGALSWGAPFQPFNRSDQITFTQKFSNLSILGSLIFQNDYVNNSPSGKSYLCQTNSLIPNMHAQIKYKSDNIIVGAGADYKRLIPSSYTVSPKSNLKYKTNEGVNSIALLAYVQAKTGKLSVSSKCIYAGNISESLMLGAYGISAYDSITGHQEYTTYKHYFVWANIVYGDKLKGGIFGGYLKNLGATKNLVPKTIAYGLGENIAYMYRVTPFISYTSGKVTLAGEVECNIAAYGSIDYANKGKIINTEEVLGLRTLLTLTYFF